MEGLRIQRLREEGPSLVFLAFGVGLSLALPSLGLHVAVPVLALYHHIRPDSALGNPVRARLYETVARQPGITIQDAAERVGIARTTAAYHLRLLGRQGLVLERPARKTVHYYRNDGRLTETQQLQLQALASSRTRNLAVVLASRPGLQRSELAAALGVTIATVNWHLRPLVDRGLLREELQGRRRLLYPTDALRSSLELLDQGAAALMTGMPPAAGTNDASAFAPPAPLPVESNGQGPSDAGTGAGGA
jgi:predicted transcriptional regulator